MKKNMPSFLGRRRLRAGDTSCNQRATGTAEGLPRGGEALMPEEHDERAAHGERGDFDDFDDEEFDDYGEPDDFDDLDDDDDDGPGPHWPAPGFPPGTPGEPPGGWHRSGPWGGGAARRGWLLALT